MSIDFFQVDCQSNTTNKAFGICDNQDGSPAFIDITDQSIWIAKVTNDSEIEVTLTAIDNCINIFRADGSMDRRCDAMMTYANNIVFVELKDQRRNWITDALEQIETTIINFIKSHDLTVFRHKRAFATNKQHPNFRSAYLEEYQRFYRTYRVRLNIEATIKI